MGNFLNPDPLTHLTPRRWGGIRAHGRPFHLNTLKLFLVAITIIAGLIALSPLGIAGAQSPTPTPSPIPVKPVITFNKIPFTYEGGAVVEFTIVVTNVAANPDQGDVDESTSGILTIDDPLQQPGMFWYLTSVENAECAPFNITTGYNLHCTTSGLRGRHLNDSQTAFVYDSATIVVRGIKASCGTVTNTAILTGDDLARPLIASAEAGVPCVPAVTPTPTSTPIPPTPTPTSTVAPPTPTSTPQIIYVEVTPTPKPIPAPAVVPGAPKTGNTDSTTVVSASAFDSAAGYLIWIFGLVFIAGIIATAIHRLRS